MSDTDRPVNNILDPVVNSATSSAMSSAISSPAHSAPSAASGAPTVRFYAQLQHAFDHFNQALFGGSLPPALITLRSSNRYHGYHHAKRFMNTKGEWLDELGMHPGFMALRSVEEVLSTLVHEMVHHWQQHEGSPSKSNPHNREWARKMRSIGLVASDTALPDGRETGHGISHYIEPQGPFHRACIALLAQGFALEWFDRHAPVRPEPLMARPEQLKAAGVAVELSPPPVVTMSETTGQPVSTTVVMSPPKSAPDRVKYVCQTCGIKAWAAPETPIQCGTCGEALVTPEAATATAAALN